MQPSTILLSALAVLPAVMGAPAPQTPGTIISSPNGQECNGASNGISVGDIVGNLGDCAGIGGVLEGIDPGLKERQSGGGIIFHSPNGQECNGGSDGVTLGDIVGNVGDCGGLGAILGLVGIKARQSGGGIIFHSPNGQECNGGSDGVTLGDIVGNLGDCGGLGAILGAVGI